MADDLSVILDEVLTVKSNLRALPADAFSERVELRVRLVELKAAVADAAHEPATAITSVFSLTSCNNTVGVGRLRFVMTQRSRNALWHWERLDEYDRALS